MKLNILVAESSLGLSDCSMACKECVFAGECEDYWRRDFECICEEAGVYLYLHLCTFKAFFLYGGTHQFISFNGFVMTLCSAMERKTGARAKQRWRVRLTSTIIHKETFVVLPSLSSRINIHHQTFVKFNLVCLQHREQIRL